MILAPDLWEQIVHQRRRQQATRGAVPSYSFMILNVEQIRSAKMKEETMSGGRDALASLLMRSNKALTHARTRHEVSLTISQRHGERGTESDRAQPFTLHPTDLRDNPHGEIGRHWG